MSDSFRALGLNDRLLAAIEKVGYTDPTPIQTAAIPFILAGRDVVGSAQTGTGKTAAFTLPILQKLSAPGALRALVVTPTRELAAQVEENIRSYAMGTGLRTTIVVGGMPMRPQIATLRRGVDILVATPGRLLDHLTQGTVRLTNVEILVLDEMDQMLDMGFIPDVRRIVASVPLSRQTLLFSATVPPEVEKMIAELTKNPERVAVSKTRVTASGVTQYVVLVQKDQKKSALLAFLRDWKRQQLLVFTRTKRGAEGLARFLEKYKHQVSLIHGDRSQNQRTAALAAFKNGKSDIMVATSIAARGLDIPDVSHVVNFDVPTTPDEYIHRVGRTARAAATGEAFTFVTPEQLGELRDIEKVLGNAINRTGLPTDMPDVPVGPAVTPMGTRPGRPPFRSPQAQPQRPYDKPARGAMPSKPIPRQQSGYTHAHQPVSAAPAPLAPQVAHVIPDPAPHIPTLPPLPAGFGWKIFSAPRTERSTTPRSAPSSGSSATPPAARRRRRSR